jgi:hypothetical protein
VREANLSKKGFPPAPTFPKPSRINAYCERWQRMRPKGGFNPRACVGRDKGPLEGHEFLAVSIHAPAWGATFEGAAKNPVYAVSIHAPAWGATSLVYQ